MDAVQSTIEEVRRRLERAKASIKAELRDYPQPITACDAQYNHLARERREVGRALARLDEIARERASGGDPTAAMEALVRSLAEIGGDAAVEAGAGLEHRLRSGGI